MIQIKCYGPLRETVSQISLEVQTPLSIRQLLLQLCQRYPALQLFDASGKFAPHIVVLVEGKNMWSQEGLETKITQRTTVALVHPIEGG